ncbi:MAG: glycosyltransferase family 4 protein [Nitrososphaerota archaeon]|nr:glycosyltransferase family 4 protein [Nitrososphaerota archaeon]
MAQLDLAQPRDHSIQTKIRRNSLTAGSSKCDRVVVIAPGDITQPHTGDVEFSSLLRHVLERHFSTELFCFKQHSIMMPRAKVILNLPKWMILLSRRLLTTNGVVIIINYPQIAVFAQVLRKLFSKEYHVVSFIDKPAKSRHESHAPTTLLWFLNWSLGYALSDAVIFNKSTFSPSLISGFAKPHVAVPGMLVDTSSFFFDSDARTRLRGSLGLDENAPVVGLIGPFHRYNLPSLNYLRDNISRYRKDIEFLIIGDCPAINRFAHERVRFAGRVTRLDEWLSACDVILIPRYINSGAPMGKMINAMAIGLPVVTNNAEAMSVTNGIDAVICPIDDFPKSVGRLFDDSAESRLIGNNARLKILNEFSTLAYESPLSGFIQKLVTGSVG